MSMRKGAYSGRLAVFEMRKESLARRFSAPAQCITDMHCTLNLAKQLSKQCGYLEKTDTPKAGNLLRGVCRPDDVTLSSLTIAY